MNKDTNCPEDIKQAWLNPIRSAQAACTNNNGLAFVTLRVIVSGLDPIIWLTPEVELIEPKRVAKNFVTHPEIVSAVAALLGTKVSTVDIE